MENSTASRKSSKVGTVVSTAMDKTVTVKVESLVKHKLYHRFVMQSRKFMAHDESNECKVGDKVQITECRPLSRHKRWRVAKVIERVS
jgi:small subunit ribosomal protein S17